MTTLTATILDGTLNAEDTAFDGGTPAWAGSFQDVSLQREDARSEGTEINGQAFVQGIELSGGFSASSDVVGSSLSGQEIDGNREYWFEALNFSGGGFDDSTGFTADFDRLATELKTETAHLSSATMIAGHQAFQEIVGMGQEAIPLILQDLERAPTQWFLALRSITRESPVRPEDRGNVEAMTTAWLDWGTRRRYIEL